MMLQTGHLKSSLSSATLKIEDALLQQGRESSARLQKMRELADTIKMSEMREKPRISKNSEEIVRKMRQDAGQTYRRKVKKTRIPENVFIDMDDMEDTEDEIYEDSKVPSKPVSRNQSARHIIYNRMESPEDVYSQREYATNSPLGSPENVYSRGASGKESRVESPQNTYSRMPSVKDNRVGSPENPYSRRASAKDSRP